LTQTFTNDAFASLAGLAGLTHGWMMKRQFPRHISVADLVKQGFGFRRAVRLPGSAATAFTLVEVLVVIALVAILAALILGPLQGMIKRGHSAVTASNLKQLAAAMHTYAADNGGFLPTDMAAGGPFWIKELWQIIYPDKPYKPMTSQQHGDFYKGTVFHTPAIEIIAADGRLPRSFGANARVRVHSVGSYNSALGNDRARLITIPFPSKAFYLAESVSSVQVDFSTRDTQLNFRNDGRGWFLFVDGHLELLAREDVPDDRDSAFWGGPKLPEQ
jgi:prepilin-type N-terminal cleavage/methylation domain-containing protein